MLSASLLRLWRALVMLVAIAGLLASQEVKPGMDDSRHRGDRNKTAASPSPDPAALVGILGSEVSLAQKREASQQLVRAGKAAIPVLIGYLRDPRVYERRDIVNRTNLPGFEPPPEPRIANISVDSRCLDLLYEIVTPVGSPISANFKGFIEQKLQVDDWRVWWAANQGKSLADIHAELKPLVDEYWKRHGTTQNVKSAGDPAEWEQGFPLPKGALGNGSPSAASSLEPGRKSTQKLYEVAASLETITAFYRRQLPTAGQSSEAGSVKFSGPAGSVMLSRSSVGTRIALVVGQR